MYNKAAIVCNTPYQILNALNIAVNKVENIVDIDLFVIDCFSNSKKIISNLKDSGIFSKVIVCEPKEIVGNKFRTLMELCFSKRLLRRYKFSDLSFLNTKYDMLFVGDGNELGLAIYNLNKCSVIAFDDGAISYFGNCFHDTIGECYRKIGRLLHVGVYSYKINKIYVNCKDVCESKVGEIVQLPILNKENSAVQQSFDIFEYDYESNINDCKYILLDQVLTEKKGFNGKELNILYENSEAILKKGMVRKHPRKGNICFDDIKCDMINNMWELECMDKIKEDNVLIGAGSTAQINPKLIVNKEPYIIFVYKLFFENNKEFEKIAEMTKNMYKCKEKIFVPKDLVEFRKIISELEK